MHQPDPENAARENEVEITDLDSLPETGKGAGRSARQSRLTSFRARVWISIAVFVGFVLLFFTVLVNVSHVPKTTKMAVLPVHINYPVSLTEVNGIGYATSPYGVVTSFRVSDGTLLWRHTGGMIYVSTQDGHLSALRASDGFPLCSVALHATDLLSPIIVTGNVIYVGTFDGIVQ